MPKFSPQDTARDLLRGLRTAYTECYWLGSQQVVPVIAIAQRIDVLRNNMTMAHSSLLTLQGAFSNTVIAARIGDHLEPRPADLPAAYTAARTAVLAALDDYGTNVLPVLPWPYTWDEVQRQHVPATFNLDDPVTLKANIIAARDALEVFH